MNRDAEYRAKFDERALDPESWRESVRQLVSVADLMIPKMDEFIEHLSRSGELTKILGSQKFQKLRISAGLETIAQEEAYLLQRLERSAIWYGRYPIPVRSDDLDRVVAAESRKGELKLSRYSTLDSDWIRRFLWELGVWVRRSAGHRARCRRGWRFDDPIQWYSRSCPCRSFETRFEVFHASTSDRARCA